jgi:hypothetical protein
VVAASLIVAVAALLVAAVSAVFTRQQAVFARQQAMALRETASIDAKRHHDSLTPEFTATCTQMDPARTWRNPEGTFWAQLWVELTGPPGLLRLDDVTVRIREAPRPVFEPWRQAVQGDRRTFGPFLFHPEHGSTDEGNRLYGPITLHMGEPRAFLLARKNYKLSGSFRSAYEDKPASQWLAWAAEELEPIRLEITGGTTGHDLWTVRLEVMPTLHTTVQASVEQKPQEP